MEGLVISLIVSLLLTEALEIPFCMLAWRFRGGDTAVCALANAVTNPPVVLTHAIVKAWLLSRGMGAWAPAVTAALEVGAVIVEWLIYRGCTGKKHPFWVSLTANAFSYSAGLMISLLL